MSTNRRLIQVVRLCEAAYLSRVEAAKLILEREDIDINLPDKDGRTALFWACNNNCLEMVNLLLERDDIDPNPRAINWGCTLLAHACRAGGSIAILCAGFFPIRDTNM